MVFLARKRSKITRKMVDYGSRDSPYGSDEQHGVGHYFDLADKFRSFKAEIRSGKEDNDKIMQAREKQVEVNAVTLKSLS